MKRFLSLLMVLVLMSSILVVPTYAAEAEGSTITVSGNSYRSKYVVISDGTASGLYYINNSGLVQNTDGTEATFPAGSYTVYYGIFSGWGSSFASGTATIREDSTNVSVRLSSARVGSNTAYATRYLYATSLYHNTGSFNHVDLRVAATYEISIGNQTYTAAVYNPSVVVKVGSRQVASKSWSGTTSYEWRQDGLNLTKSSIITVELTLDLHYTDSKGTTQIIEDVVVVYDNVNDVDKFIEAIAICDMVWGLDFRVDVEEIQEIITSKTTGADGYAHFDGYTVPEDETSVTCYLRETKAPNGYYLSEQVYKVVITALTNAETGKTTYEPEISLLKGRNSGFDIETDLLTVTNFPVLGNCISFVL